MPSGGMQKNSLKIMRAEIFIIMSVAFITMLHFVDADTEITETVTTTARTTVDTQTTVDTKTTDVTKETEEVIEILVV
ncbi:unnamed protein product [Schistosoma bovis]|nr:unnamed protein product [Schistosoma bovis]CAH8626731.1 unnamed protein product [Schistosoma haematobium]